MRILYLILAILVVSGCINSGITGNAVDVIDQNDKITIGINNGPISALLMVAKDKGFFEEEGLNVELVEFTAGKLALQAFLANSLDLAATAEVPVMYSALQGNEFYVITQLVEKAKDNVRIVALKDDGLDNPSAYFNSKKRRLATSFGTVSDFFVYKFIKKYNISDIELVGFQDPIDMPAALGSGTVDALAVHEPFAFFAEKRVGERTISFRDDEVYSEQFVLIAHRNWVNSNPEVAEKIIRSLVKASMFIEENPEEAKTVVSGYTELDKETLNGMWDTFVFKPVLNRLLIEYMNEEAQWAKETGRVKPETKIPDFKEYIYKNTLEKVKPDAVTI